MATGKTVAPFLLLTSIGCAGDGKSSLSKNGLNSVGGVPVALRGQYVTLKIEMPGGDQRIAPGRFRHDEICYLNTGNFRIDCYPDGSTLTFGANDAADLLTDHAPSSLQPADDDSAAQQSMRLYALVTLIGGSIDRLPSALSDYLQTPGQHLDAAIDMVEQMLSDNDTQISGFARGGNFVVTMQLNDSGREKLIDALDEHADSPGQTQYVDMRLTAEQRVRISKAIHRHRPIGSKPRSRTTKLGARDESDPAASIVDGPPRTTRTEIP